MKRLLFGTLSSFIMISTIPTSTFAADYNGHWMEEGIKEAINKKILIPENGNVYPNKEITRAEFAAMITRSLRLTKEGNMPFLDITGNHALYNEINKAYQAQLISGHDDLSFKPNNKITREEMAIMLERMLSKYNMNFTGGNVNFKDKGQIVYLASVSRNTNLGIIYGYPDKSFKPKQSATVAESTAFVLRAIESLKKANKLIVNYNTQPNNNPPSSDNYDEVPYFDLDPFLGTIARTKGFTNIYDSTMKKQITYVTGSVELEVIEVLDDKVRINISGQDGYVKKDSILLSPTTTQTERSYYKNVNGELKHYIYSNGSYSSPYTFGRAPSNTTNGETIHSWDGVNFKGVENYQYFNNLPLRVKSNYTGAEIDAYIRSVSPNSPLIGLGQAFVDAANKENINALYLFANAAVESSWGKSKIAQDKNNLFGISAVDSDPYNQATAFPTMADCIFYAAKMVSDRYLSPSGIYYNGALLGNKSKGMNVKYASDPYWGQKISSVMYRADSFLGKRDFNRYTLSRTIKSTNVYRSASTSSTQENIPYKVGSFIAISGTVTNSQGTWYKIVSDFKNNSSSYVRAQDIRIINTAK